MTRLVDSPGDLSALISQTNDATGIPAAFLEKDVWVVELLRSVAKPMDGLVIFKGGTSLSKAYDLVERFSEDVDILLVPPDGCGSGCCDRLLKGICARAGEDLQIQGSDGFAEKGVHRSLRYSYGVAFRHEQVSEGVLLEIGIRGGADPHERRVIRSYVASHAIEALGASEGDFDEFGPVEIDVLRPERTLVEKLAIVHHLSGLPADDVATTEKGRHFYDIYQLLGAATVLDAIGHAGFVPNAAADASAVSAKYGWPSSPRPSKGYGASPAFDPDHLNHDLLAAAYGRAVPLIYGSVPSFDEVVERVRLNAELL